MNAIAEQWRRQAAEYREQLPVLVKRPTVSVDVIAALKASMMPELLEAMADMVELNTSRQRRESVTTVLRAAA